MTRIITQQEKLKKLMNPSNRRMLSKNSENSSAGSTGNLEKTTAKLLSEGYKNAGKNPVRITDYPAPAGMGGISYSDNGLVSVGGKNVPVLYMDGERAVVDSNELDKAYASLAEQTGIKTADSLYSDWMKNYGKKAENAYADMSNYEDWSYNPENDPAYNAYKEMYQREGDRAYRDAAARMASKNMGNMTSAAQTVANQQLGYYMSMLADRIPELMKNSYERYKNGFNMKKDVYNAATDDASNAWERMFKVNDTNKKDYSDWLEKERQRTLDRQADELWKITAEGKSLDNAFTKEKTDGEKMYNVRLGVLTEGDKLANDLTRIKTEGEKIANENAMLKKAAQEMANLQKAIENAWANGEKRGYYTEEEMKLLNMFVPEETEESRGYSGLPGFRSGAARTIAMPQNIPGYRAMMR